MGSGGVGVWMGWYREQHGDVVKVTWFLFMNMGDLTK